MVHIFVDNHYNVAGAETQLIFVDNHTFKVYVHFEWVQVFAGASFSLVSKRPPKRFKANTIKIRPALVTP